MPVRRRGNKLERWEIALIKAMFGDGRWANDHDSPDIEDQAPQDDGYTQANTASMPQQLQNNANAVQSQAPEYIAHILLFRDKLKTS